MHLPQIKLAVSAIATSTLLIMLAGCGKPQYVVETEHFATTVKSKVNPDELQSWATNLFAHPTNFDRLTGEVNSMAVPDFIKRISAEQQSYITVDHAPDGKADADAYVYIMYGGGFGHWGLLVGSPAFSPHVSRNGYCVKWKSGIYFYCGD